MRTIWLIGAHGAPCGFIDYSCRINRLVMTDAELARCGKVFAPF